MLFFKFQNNNRIRSWVFRREKRFYTSGEKNGIKRSGSQTVKDEWVLDRWASLANEVCLGNGHVQFECKIGCKNSIERQTDSKNISALVCKCCWPCRSSAGVAFPSKVPSQNGKRQSQLALLISRVALSMKFSGFLLCIAMQERWDVLQNA